MREQVINFLWKLVTEVMRKQVINLQSSNNNRTFVRF